MQVSLHVSAVYFPKTILAYHTVLVEIVCPSVLYKLRLPQTLDLNIGGASLIYTLILPLSTVILLEIPLVQSNYLLFKFPLLKS